MKSIDFCPQCGTECIKETKKVLVQMQMANPVPPVEVERTYYTARYDPNKVRELIDIMNGLVSSAYPDSFVAGIRELLISIETDVSE